MSIRNFYLFRRPATLCVSCLLAVLAVLPARAQDTPSRQQAIAWYDRMLAGECRPFNEMAALFDTEDQAMPAAYVLSAQTDTPAESIVLFEFFCDAGAYNVRTVYVEHAEGRFRQLWFSSPAISVDYQSDADDADVKSIAITGFEARPTVTNAEFDPATLTIKETAYWRGVGDASNETWWRFVDGRFVLERFRVDASYDGEVNPQLDATWPGEK